MLGQPTIVQRCGGSGEGGVSAGCVREYSYSFAWQPVDEWIVEFDRQGRVVRKAHLMSP
jgi:hypothetical protein